MQAKVLIDFIDKETKAYNRAGSIIEVSEARSKEILKAGKYIALMEPEIREESIDEMSLAELKDYAKKNGIALNGARTKDAIIEAIRGSEE